MHISLTVYRNNNKTIDLSRTVRLSGLTSGARLELVASSKSPSVVSVALQLPQAEADGTTRLTDKIPSDTTLWRILRKFESTSPSSRNYTGRGIPVAEGQGSGAGRLYFETPVIQIMGRELVSFTDLQKTLAQLGFNSGSTLLRLNFRRTETPLEEAMIQIGQYFKDVEEEVAPEKKSDSAEAMDISSDKPHESATKDLDGPDDEAPGLTGAQNPTETASTSPKNLNPASQNVEIVTGPSQRPIAVFAPPSSSTPQAAQQAFNEADYEPTVDHAKMHQQRLKSKGQNQRLLTDAELAAQAEDQARRSAQIREVVIRVRFPDQTQVDATFTSSDTAGHLYDHVRGLMLYTEEPFNLQFNTSKGPHQIPHNPDTKLISDVGLKARELVTFVWAEGASNKARLGEPLKEEFRQKAQQLQVKEIQGVEVEEKRAPAPQSQQKDTKEKKAGIPKWLKLPGKK